jgi:isoquinoline 1-oxidoreductase beta subunit
MTCVADATNGKCEVWAPTQDRQTAQRQAAGVSKVSQKDVIVHVPLIGGAFGRRLQVDYVKEAVEISQAINAPVKVFWTRADDIQHDFYHPFQITQMSARLELNAFGSMRQLGSGYNVPTGAWRSVENHPDAFFRGSFIDELAAALGQDPLEAHLAAYQGGPLEAVLQLAAEKANWNDPLPEGWGRGIAAYSTFSVTHVAQVIEVSIENGKVRVHRVVCAVNCGQVINPDTVKAQMEGGIVFGLSAALYGEIIIEKGRVTQSNYHDYPVMRFDECPEIEVYILDSDERPTGTGEMGVPPTAPALMNAIFAATGKRLRRFPVSAETF